MIPPMSPHGLALFLDVDGTLIDIAARPDAVVVPAALVSDLEAANRRLGGALALVSGRTIGMLDALFHPLRLRASGVHGAEFRFDPAQAEPTAGPLPLPANLWRAVEDLIRRFPGTLAENKAYSYAVHYRAVPNAEPSLRAELDRLAASQVDLPLRLMPGHFVFELKRTDFNKGTAVDAFMGRPEFAGRRPVFIGDDVTDWPGFSAAVRHGGSAYSVGAAAAGTIGTFPAPEAVRHWLGQMIQLESMTA